MTSRLAPSPDRGSARLTAQRVTPLARARLTAVGLYDELYGSWRIAADTRSFGRFAADALGYRAQRVLDFGDPNRRRTVRFKGDVELTYRLNRGDVRAIAETWVRHAYELPFSIDAPTMVDFGANIGAAGAWLARRHRATRVVAVEPVAENADLARINLARTGAHVDVIVAAVAATEGTGHFRCSDNSTLGRLDDEGVPVRLVTPESVVDRIPTSERIGLVKIDIEGAEQQLFQADLGWLDRVDALALELHADRVDWLDIIAKVQRRGFRRYDIAASSHYCGPTDVMVAFKRERP